MNTPEYGTALRLHDDCRCYPPFFASAEDAPKDWAFVNIHGAHTFPKIVYEVSKKVKIIIKVGYYFGLYDSGYSVDEKCGTGCSSPAMATTAQIKAWKTEKEAVADAISRIYKRFENSESKNTPEFKEFDLWAKEYTRPQPKQLDLFSQAA